MFAHKTGTHGLLPTSKVLNLVLAVLENVNCIKKKKKICRRGYLRKEKVVPGSYSVLEVVRFLLNLFLNFFS